MSRIKVSRGARVPPSKMPAAVSNGLPMCMAVVYRSLDGNAWEPLLRESVPDWALDAGVMRHMLDGVMVQKLEHGPYWYRAERIRDNPDVHSAPGLVQ